MNAESLPTDTLIGQVLADRYEILHRLGQGAMGVVYKARHIKVGRPFAVKVLHARLLQDTKVAQRFDREAALAGRLRHANVIGVVDVGELDGMRYMVMDFAEGPDLAQLLSEAPMSPRRIIHLVRQLLEGLYHAHEQGLIHRDFKPENVIIERDAHGAELPRIVDFGIAILRDGGDATDGHGRLTTNGMVLGTPHYMAPEQAVADPIDHRIDLFALGIVIYEMLSGRLPFDGSGAEVARANLLIDPPPIVARVPYLEVDPLLEAFARRLLSKKRNARPANAKVARELLDLIDRDRPAAAAALGLPAAAHAPAVTQPVASQTPGSSSEASPPAQTMRLKATPTPGHRELPAIEAESPQLPAAPPQPSPLHAAAPPLLHVPAPGPNALGAPDAPRTSQASGTAHETSIRTPLDWPPIANRRRPLLITGVALGAAGILAGLLIARAGAKQDRSVDDQRVVMAPVGPNAATPPTPTATAPRATEPAAAKPAAIEPTAAAPAAIAPSAGEPMPATRRMPARDPKPHDPRAVDAKAAEANPGRGANPGPPRATDPPPAGAHDGTTTEAKAATPKAPPTGGITADAVSSLYYSVVAKINLLPSNASEDLRTRWRLYSVQALMLASQAERDQAAEQLAKLRDEAVARLAKLRTEAPSNAR